QRCLSAKMERFVCIGGMPRPRAPDESKEARPCPESQEQTEPRRAEREKAGRKMKWESNGEMRSNDTDCENMSRESRQFLPAMRNFCGSSFTPTKILQPALVAAVAQSPLTRSHSHPVSFAMCRSR